MKKFTYTIIATVLMALMACSSTKSPAEVAARHAADSIAHAQAIVMLDSMDFITRASQVQIKGGRIIYSDSEFTNFLCANGGYGVVQLASMRNPGPGFNGLGGLTIRGDIRLLKKTTDKSGRTTYEYNLTAPVASCRIVVSIPKDGTRVLAQITGNFRGGTVSIMGPIEPYDPTTIALGRYL